LSIVLLKEVILTPLAEKAHRPNRQTRIQNHAKKAFQNVKTNVKKFKDFSNIKGTTNKQTSPEMVNEMDIYTGMDDKRAGKI
jgi:hypothetical protein